uniref:Putative basic 7S globulin-like n=1 Tax=Davidia involucrata TaxID=16924 RepID=A0A5B7BX02_DAVIN
MASSLQFLLCSFICLITISAAQRPHLPSATVLLPVTKDVSTLQYVTRIYLGTPLLPIKLVVDLGGPFLWIDCASGHVSSSSYHPIQCGSLQCSMAKGSDSGNDNCFNSNRPCHKNKQCGLYPENTITRVTTRGELAEDTIAVGSESTGSITAVHHFIFTCAPTSLLQGLASGVKGILGLGRSRIALPSQLATALGFHHRKFTVCLSSSAGVILPGDLPGTDILKSLMYTPLMTNQDGTILEHYHINVRSIKINGKRVSLNTSLLVVDQQGYGGTRISTVVPYTTLESTIYDTFTKAYIKIATAMNMTRVASVAPFGVCFRPAAMPPTIDLVLQSQMVKWRIYGRNSMVKVSDEVMCLGFLDGGLGSRNSIVIGGYQLEDNLLEFNLGTSMLGFSSSLLMRGTSCSNFKLSSMASELM